MDFPKHTYFHLSNSGVEKRPLFSTKNDFDRFEAYLYLLNAIESPRAANFFVGNRAQEIFTAARGELLVSIAAYSLTPREFHILAKSKIDGGISKFMQKLQTAYTMYFNAKYARSGRLFRSAYSAEEILSDDHLKYMQALIHLHPAELFDEAWKESEGRELEKLALHAMHYRYSSINEYANKKFVITSPHDFPKAVTRINDLHSHLSVWKRNRDDFLKQEK